MKTSRLFLDSRKLHRTAAPHPMLLSRGHCSWTGEGSYQTALARVVVGGDSDGCSRSQTKVSEPPPPEVNVSTPVTREITDFEEFTGHTEAVKTIDVRARVSGYLEKVFFKEGVEVNEGDPLFEIDRRTYQADYDRAVANLAQAEAHLTRMEANYKRAKKLIDEARHQPGRLRPGGRRPRRGGGGGQGGGGGPGNRQAQPGLDPRHSPPSAAASAGNSSIRATWSRPTTRC